jgi:hypothetical protein
LLANFIRHSLKDESISQYKLKPSALVTELIQFSNTFKDDEDEPSILESQTPTRDEVEQVESELERVLRMFYLQMRVKGHLKPYKEDYFV